MFLPLFCDFGISTIGNFEKRHVMNALALVAFISKVPGEAFEVLNVVDFISNLLRPETVGSSNGFGDYHDGIISPISIVRDRPLAVLADVAC